MNVIVDAIIYVLQKIKEADKIKIIKLIYLADKCHLAKYGRTITEDEYYAMEKGPVGSMTKDILGFDEISIPKNILDTLSFYIEKVNNYTFEAKDGNGYIFNNLSETDKEVLDYVIEKFGNKTSKELSSYTHKYPEWYAYKELFENSLTKREHIKTKELLSKIKNDLLLCDIPDEHIQQTKDLLEGKF